MKARHKCEGSNEAAFDVDDIPGTAPGGENDMLAEMHIVINKQCAEGLFSGSVLVARGEQVLLEKACGEANKRYSVPNNIDTKFNLGSMNSQMAQCQT